MIGIGKNLFKGNVKAGGAVAYDADALAYFTANTAITSAADKNAINTFYLGLKTDGIYTKIKAMYLPIWGSAASCKWNLINNRTFDLSFSTGWTFSSSGATPNGTSAYCNTFIIPSSNFNNTTFNHLSYYSRTNNNNIDFLMGSRNSNETALILSGRDTFWGYYCDNSGSTYRSSYNTTLRNTAAMSIGTQQGSNIKVFRNNNLIAQNTEVKFALSTFGNRNIIVGAWDDNGTISNYTNKQCSFVSIGISLSDTDVNNLYTRVQTLMTYFGINV